jgi:hypothetical protein
MSENRALAVAQAEGQHGGRNRPRIRSDEPRGLRQRLNGRVGWSAAQVFLVGRLGDHHGRTEVPQQVNQAHLRQEDEGRRVDDPE